MTITSFTMLLILYSPTPPVQEGVTTVLGPKAYRDGDVIEITDVTATSPRLEQGDTVTVRGRVHLHSQEKAQLSLYLTATQGQGSGTTDAAQLVTVSKGQSEFELKITIKNRGVLHLTFYDEQSGKPFGGTYFGTAEQMAAIADWDVGYYLSGSDDHSREARQRPGRRQPTLLSSLGFEFKPSPGFRYVRVDDESDLSGINSFYSFSIGGIKYAQVRIPTVNRADR